MLPHKRLQGPGQQAVVPCSFPDQAHHLAQQRRLAASMHTSLGPLAFQSVLSTTPSASPGYGRVMLPSDADAARDTELAADSEGAKALGGHPCLG